MSDVSNASSGAKKLPETEAGDKLTVVVAEDSAPNRKILSTLLSKMGFHVEEAINGEEAWKFIEQAPAGLISLLITDYMMPLMDGLQLIEKVRAHEPCKGIPILVSSAISDKEVILRAKELEVTGYLVKPLRSEILAKRMTELFPKHPGLAKFKAAYRSI
jgi:two-component system chemotaxis response regulator CheY